MIRLTIDVWPHGDESAKQTIHTIDIANRGPVEGHKRHPTTDLRKYDVRMDGGEWVEGVNHYRSQSIFVLVYKVMEIML